MQIFFSIAIFFVFARCKCDKIFNFDIYDGNNTVILLRAVAVGCT